MNLHSLLQGLALGFAIAAPVGPIGILVIRRTLASGPRIGFVSGLGAATADACYGAVAAFGITAVSRALLDDRTWIQFVGGVLLLYLGVTLVLSRPAQRVATAEARGFAGAYLSVAGLTLTNPSTILSFVAAFAALGVGSGHAGAAASALLVAGVFCGSAAWWAVLSSGVALLRARLTAGRLALVDRAAGAILALFGLGAVFTAIRSMRVT